MTSDTILDTQTIAHETLPFAELLSDESLVNTLLGLGISVATPVQTAAIPAALQGGDLIVQAQTGSGKTLAFALPLIMSLRADPKIKRTHALILTPTRELALQVCRVIHSVAPEISPPCIIGGMKVKAQLKALHQDPRIVVGTPGRVLDLIERRELDLHRCREFVLDEADEMLSMGFLEEVRDILRKIPKPRRGQFFSATITPRVQQLASGYLSSPSQIAIATNNDSAPEIEHLVFRTDAGIAEKATALCNIIEVFNPSSAIVFCNTKSDTELVEVYLKRRGFDARRLNSDLSQRERDTIMKALREGDLRLLIATDVAARGIDITALDMVFNYSIHEQAEAYVHRTGRTGRAGRKGTAINLVGPADFAAFHNLNRTLKIPMKELPLPTKEEVERAKAQRVLAEDDGEES